MSEQKKRKYTFKNQAYWDGLKAPKSSAPKLNVQVNEAGQPWTPLGADLSTGSTYTPGAKGRGSTTTRRNHVSTNELDDQYANLNAMSLPYYEEGGNISISDTITLCQKVYANIAIFRNTVDIMTEFGAAPIYLEGGNEASKTFIENWLKKINEPKLTEEVTREWYLTGNVFIFRFDGIWSDEDFKELKKVYAAKSNKIPARYTVLNSAQILVYPAASFDYNPYRKVLSPYEIEKLRLRQTEEDKAIWKALPDDVKKQIENKQYGTDGIWMPIPSEKLTALFYKKQPYQPFATPFGYPVFKDLNHKEELKKIDQAISRTIENVTLLVTMGEKRDPTTGGGGMNPVAMEKMQELLANQSVSRVVVSDYTTKMEFIIPEIGEILNPQKYEIVNQDIKEGLLNILSSDDKFANAVMKTKIFLERLKEGRKTYLNSFLQPEINRVCKAMGFKKVPVAKFQEIDLKDEIQYAKIFTRLMEIGVLTPEQGKRAMETGILPEDTDMEAAQTRYVEQRKKGMYNPLLGGVPMAIAPEAEANRELQKELGEKQIAQKAAQSAQKTGTSNPNATNNGRPSGSSAPQSTKEVSPQGTSSAHLVSVANLRTTLQSVSDLMHTAETKVKEKYNLTELNSVQKDMVFKLSNAVISTTKKEEWDTQLAAVLQEPEKHLATFKRNEISQAVEELAVEHQVDTFSASLLYHSKWHKQ